jgi:hypothetical protein
VKSISSADLAAKLIDIPGPGTITKVIGAFSFPTIALGARSSVGFEGVVAVVHCAGMDHAALLE